MAGYDTNLAAEFHVLACLHRLGIAAALTLGNKKGVDILVARGTGDAVTVEVKGVAGKWDWPADNIRSTRTNHFIVLVSFEGAISNLSMPAPSVWVIPSGDLAPFCRNYKGRRNVSRAAVLKGGKLYRDAWQRIGESGA